MTTPFAATWRDYLANGYAVRSIPLGSKGPRKKGWQNPDSEQPEGFYEAMANDANAPGIALLLGMSFPDGTTLGALDI